MTDSREISAPEAGGRALAIPERQSESFLAMILKAASDPTVDAEKVKTLADLAVSLQDRERETEFAQDFAAALMEMPYISKNNVITIPGKDGKPERQQGTFAAYEDLDKVIKPILAKHHMVLSFRLGSEGPFTTATPILTHLNGYRDIGEPLKVPADKSGSKNDAQAVGSASQYAKRYAATAHLNIVTVGEDKDGRAYPLPEDPLSSRQERLIAEAHQSAADGNYTEWFARQTPKDRSWLVIRGVHAQHGAPAIPGQAEPTASPPPPPPPPAPSPPPPAGTNGSLDLGAEPSSNGGAKRRAESPEDWAKTVIAEIGRIQSANYLDEYLDRKREPMARLEASRKDLYDQIIEARDQRREALDA